MRDAHVAREIGNALAVSEDLGGHAISLALIHPAALRDSDTRGILAPLSIAVSRVVPNASPGQVSNGEN